uniref:Late embryogenesis abundant protein n=1 Tax=Tamarix hispida TaxID=189793 RepID=W0FD89_9CARY|nr:late embryogenesis abundant protein [Tamarix hispida]
MDYSILSNQSGRSPYDLLLEGLQTIPISHYLIGLSAAFIVFIYNFLECHLIQDILTGFRGQSVFLTFNSESHIYEGVVSKCRILHGRYLTTPWLASPHLQTTILNFFGGPPAFKYRRKIFYASDGGTIALDWLMSSDVPGGAFCMQNCIPKDDRTPIMVVVPGLTSDSNSAYLKHLAYHSAKFGWNVVVSNHRGLGGVSITSDCFYNAGWTEDIRVVVRYLHHEYPNAPLFVVGTSIGANVLVKYLGEDGDDIPVAGAVAICSPWDLLIGDRFINRKLVQKLYDRALTIGLQGYAQLHQPNFSRLANWEGIIKSRSIRDFDHHATCIVGKYETVDTYYRNRRCSSASYIGNVAVPLLCISALDDPLCTKEAIPWDECRLNKNVVLATTKHGGHLAFFEGITGSSLWWVRAVNEFLGVLYSSQYLHTQKKIQVSGQHPPVGAYIDRGPYLNVAEDGMVAAVGNQTARNNVVEDSSQSEILDKQNGETATSEVQKEHFTDVRTSITSIIPEIIAEHEQGENTSTLYTADMIRFVKQRLNQLSRQNRRSMWLLVYISVATSWPLVGSALYFFFRKKMKKLPPIVGKR